MTLIEKSFQRTCGRGKTHMVQYDIPGSPQRGSRWLVTIRMTSGDGSGAFPYGAYTQCVVFKTSLEEGVNRGSFEDGVYVSWYAGTASCEGYSKLVEEDGQRSRFKEGRLISSSVTQSIAGDVLSVAYSFGMSEFGEGYSIGVLGGIYSNISSLKIEIIGSVEG